MAQINVITPQNVGGIIKRINERIADIGRRGAEGLGTDSELYERYEKALNMMLPAQMRGTSASGFIKINNNKQTRELLAGDYADALLKLGNYETRGEFRKRKAKLYKQEHGTEPTAEELDEMLKANKEYKKLYEGGKIQEKYNELTPDELEILRKSHNTYEELNRIMKRLFEGHEVREVRHRSRKRAYYEELRTKQEEIRIGKGEKFRFV